jgi:hypothetical protein
MKRVARGEPFSGGSVQLALLFNGPPNGGPFPFPLRKSRSAKGICDTRSVVGRVQSALYLRAAVAVVQAEIGGESPQTLPRSHAL